MRYQSLGVWAVVAAAILWSIDGLLRRSLYGLPPMVVVFWEHLLGVIILLPIILPQFRRFRELTRRQWGVMVGVSLLSGVLGTYFYTSGLLKIQFISFSVVVLLQQLQPLFAISTAAIILREPVTKKFLGLTLCALIFAYLVSFPYLHVNWVGGRDELIAAGLALLAAAAWGSSTALSKYSLRDTSVVSVTSIRFVFTALFSLLFVILLGQSDVLLTLSSVQWWTLITITFSTGLVALTLYYFGLQRVPASRSTVLELTWPVSAVLIGYFFLDERLTVTQIIGVVGLLVTMYLVSRDARQLPSR